MEERPGDGLAGDRPGKRARSAARCADVLLYLLLIADQAGIDLIDAARRKLEKNAAKYPIEKSYGSSKKYTQLDD